MGQSCGATKEPKRNPRLKVKKAQAQECKIVLLGDAAVGKSSIAQRFCKDLFSDKYEVTIGGAYLQKSMKLKNGKELKIHLWDTGGAERFRAMAPLYYRDALGAFLVYDISDKQSFNNLDYWIKELDDFIKDEKMKIAIAGNKCDVPEQDKKISTQKLKQYAEQFTNCYAETSAKTGEGVQDLFRNLCEEINRTILKKKK